MHNYNRAYLVVSQGYRLMRSLNSKSADGFNGLIALSHGPEMSNLELRHASIWV